MSGNGLLPSGLANDLRILYSVLDLFLLLSRSWLCMTSYCGINVSCKLYIYVNSVLYQGVLVFNQIFFCNFLLPFQFFSISVIP